MGRKKKTSEASKSIDSSARNKKCKKSFTDAKKTVCKTVNKKVKNVNHLKTKLCCVVLEDIFLGKNNDKYVIAQDNKKTRHSDKAEVAVFLKTKKHDNFKTFKNNKHRKLVDLYMQNTTDSKSAKLTKNVEGEACNIIHINYRKRRNFDEFVNIDSDDVLSIKRAKTFNAVSKCEWDGISFIKSTDTAIRRSVRIANKYSLSLEKNVAIDSNVSSKDLVEQKVARPKVDRKQSTISYYLRSQTRSSKDKSDQNSVSAYKVVDKCCTNARAKVEANESLEKIMHRKSPIVLLERIRKSNIKKSNVRNQKEDKHDFDRIKKQNDSKTKFPSKKRGRQVSKRLMTQVNRQKALKVVADLQPQYGINEYVNKKVPEKTEEKTKESSVIQEVVEAKENSTQEADNSKYKGDCSDENLILKGEKRSHSERQTLKRKYCTKPTCNKKFRKSNTKDDVPSNIIQTEREFSKSCFTCTTCKNGFNCEIECLRHEATHEKSIIHILQSREISGSTSSPEIMSKPLHSKMQLFHQTMGHRAAVYCLLFDQRGDYIITGADDHLVKVWSSIDGRLCATFRGALSAIVGISINLDNSLLAAAGLDGIIRVWCFQTKSPIAVLSGHAREITSLNFCPFVYKNVRYLVSTGLDGYVMFWLHVQEGEKFVFESKPILHRERIWPHQAQTMCSIFSPGGAFLVTGSTDKYLRLYLTMGEMGPERLSKMKSNKSKVDFIKWAHNNFQFLSGGSKDSECFVWTFKKGEWMKKSLDMHKELIEGPVLTEGLRTKKTITMACWDVSDKWVITAVDDFSLKVCDSKTAKLVNVLRKHMGKIRILEPHPTLERVFLSAGEDGMIFIWDVLKSEPLARFQNHVEGQGYSEVTNAKWSADGRKIVVTDAQGHLAIYGFESEVGTLVPKEQFFHDDYDPLISDANGYVLDAHTYIAPHLLPPPFLVDARMNRYPTTLQRLVPGRQNSSQEHVLDPVSEVDRVRQQANIMPWSTPVLAGPRKRIKLDAAFCRQTVLAESEIEFYKRQLRSHVRESSSTEDDSSSQKKSKRRRTCKK